jgi:hypothetical protein
VGVVHSLSLSLSLCPQICPCLVSLLRLIHSVFVYPPVCRLAETVNKLMTTMEVADHHMEHELAAVQDHIKVRCCGGLLCCAGCCVVCLLH